MRKHPLDREMGLAGVGRAEHGRDAGAGSAAGADRLERRGKTHESWKFLRRLKLKHCFTMRRLRGRGLSSGTSLERNGPESLTPVLARRMTATCSVDSHAAAPDQVPLRPVTAKATSHSLIARVESESGKSQAARI